jgi:hypothetical protein
VNLASPGTSTKLNGALPDQSMDVIDFVMPGLASNVLPII